ncbi:ABC transporter substrate-binding protein [Pseudomonas sp. MM211]|uniref:ABC transporter substrate-binding protein n=1 Tax=Pseudomonas sp. MM211 TaxID=2866808 RepID=UPI001CEC5EF0|nr:ABC transporter substrate-binding protein [Pseudomonas sp. MM211]UCJ16694.1 ABC transporter substrate-binding protein [Pseudomonas sp. MM211]
MSQPNTTPVTHIAAGCSSLWYSRCPVPTTSGIAQHYRWLHRAFAEQGVTLESVRASADAGVREAHYNHGHDNMFREGGNVPPIWARASGQDTVVVGITWVDERQVLLVREDSPLRVPADLRGQRLGLPNHQTRNVDIARTAHLRGLLTALQLAGVARDEVTFVDIGGGEFDLRETGQASPGDDRAALLKALLDGDVAAIYAKGANSVRLAEQHGLRALLDINQHPDPLVRVNAGTPRPITVNRSLVEQAPELVARYLAVLIATADWASEHPDEAAAALAAETNSSAAAIWQGYGDNFHHRLRPDLSEQYIKGLAAQKAFLLSEGFLPADFDFDAWIDPAPLRAAEALAGELEDLFQDAR